VLYKLEFYINTSSHTANGCTKEQAIFYGQLARLFDLLKMQRRMVLTDSATREILQILNRSIMETSVTLEYMIENNHPKLLDDYIMDSLRMTSAYEDEVLENIKAKGGNPSPIEESILKSIDDERKKCSLSRGDVDNWSKKKSSLVGFLARFKAVGKEQMYNIAYKGGSQSVHGNWETLSKNYLKHDNSTGLFRIDLSDDIIDIRLVNPQLYLIINVMIVFLADYSGHGLDQGDIEILNHLSIGVKQLEDEHELFMERK
jgi:hypothetical protein